MHEEIDLVVKAIESLRQEPNHLKDFAFPIASALFTSILGGLIAFLALRRQENIQIEKEKMNATNKWILLAEEARANLIAIKNNYQNNLTADPLERFAAVQSIQVHAKTIEESIENLSFIVPKSNRKVTEHPKWSSLPLIRCMKNNYNNLLKLWELRNQIERPIKEQLLAKYSEKGYAKIYPEEIIACIAPSDLVLVIDLTERAIKLTDDIIIELDNFLTEFPIYAKGFIKTKRIKKYGTILTYSNKENEKLLAVIKRTIVPDFSTVTNLFGATEKEIKNRHITGYEQ